MNLLKFQAKYVEVLRTTTIDGLRLRGPTYEFFFPASQLKPVSAPDFTPTEQGRESYREWRKGIGLSGGQRRMVEAGSKEWVSQEVAEKVFWSGEATLIEGGRFNVFKEMDGLHRVIRWTRPGALDVPPPLKPHFSEWESVETLGELQLEKGIVLPDGFRFRVKAVQWFGGCKLKECTWAGEEAKTDRFGRPTLLRILRPNPSANAVAARQLDLSQVTAKLYSELHPDSALPPVLEQAHGLPAFDPEDAPSEHQLENHRYALERQRAARAYEVPSRYDPSSVEAQAAARANAAARQPWMSVEPAK